MLEASLGQLQARNHPHAEAVAAALNRTGSTERRGGLLLSPTSPLRQKAVQAANASRGGAGAGDSCSGLAVHVSERGQLVGEVCAGHLSVAHRKHCDESKLRMHEIWHRHAWYGQSSGLVITTIGANYLLCQALGLAARP